MNRVILSRCLILSSIIMLGAAVIGCSPTIDNRGYEIETKDFKTIVPGVSTKEFVEEHFGSPSTVSTYPPEVWYYVSKTTAARSFLPAKVLDQKSYAIEFNEAGVVTKLLERNGDDVHEINPVKRTTRTVGQEQGLLREVFSNFGKIATQGGPRK